MIIYRNVMFDVPSNLFRIYQNITNHIKRFQYCMKDKGKTCDERFLRQPIGDHQIPSSLLSASSIYRRMEVGSTGMEVVRFSVVHQKSR